jgi:hypothetical protein
MQPLPLAMEPEKSLLVGGQMQSEAMFWFFRNFLHRVRHNISTQTLFFSLINGKNSCKPHVTFIFTQHDDFLHRVRVNFSTLHVLCKCYKGNRERERGAEITAIPAAISGCFSPSCVSLTRSAATCYL